jgi:hypothetical protein
MPASNAAPTGPAVPDPTICPLSPLPDTSLREVSRVDPIPSQAGTPTISPQQHIVELHAETNEVEVPAIRFGTNLANDLASGLIISPQQQTVVPPSPQPERNWYKKCLDVIKKAL